MVDRFELDRFQTEALAVIDAGRNVLVAAPTGAGKTVVATHAVEHALRNNRRAFYTTPIKALSNQKYTDLVRAHGSDRVGLLTGDNAINADADVVVMTTEVLRNMIYAGSDALDRLAWVVLDEVHYLQDTYRGPVWEEVIVHAPAPVRFVCLSATVSNADELAGWIGAARGHTETVIEHERPVELRNHYLVFEKATGQLLEVPTLVGGRPNPEGDRFDSPVESAPKHLRHKQRSRRRWATPRRAEVVEHLAAADLLPAICFIFSRAGCDDAARSVVEAGFRLTSGVERTRIRAIAERHVAHLDDCDLTVLEHDRWLAGLEAGVAAHHAGMVPPFKEAVEACFVEGLVKVVFATETLALGINMPARSVVIEALSKFTGEHHEDLTPSQYTQLTGRAGRRGLDAFGHAVVLWSPWQGFDKVAALAASREFVLRSAFRPTANMVVNLIARYDREQAHELLERSFAQFQADKGLARLAHRRAGRVRRLAEAEQGAHCERGDVGAYRELRRTERAAQRDVRRSREGEVSAAVDRLRPGDVLEVGGQQVAVLSSTYRRGRARVRLVDVDANVAELEPDDFTVPPVRTTTITLPEPYDPQNRIMQRRVSSALRGGRARRSGKGRGPGRDGPGSPPPPDAVAPVASGARDHPVATCPDLDRHLAAAAERDRLNKQVAELDRRLDDRSSSLGRQFDRMAALLERWGFVDGWALTERGEVLARVFHESDLLCASVIGDGHLDGLDPASLAAVVSMLTYEHRSKEPPPPPWFPSRQVQDRASSIEHLARRLGRDEHANGLAATRLPDPTFAALAHAWASGESLDTVIGDADLSGGDFVRNIKTLIDLLRQIAHVAPVPATRRSAGEAAHALLRGIVAASSDVPSATPTPTPTPTPEATS
ncbi:DEAD/DEAH box helicase [soil metagenome]